MVSRFCLAVLLLLLAAPPLAATRGGEASVETGWSAFPVELVSPPYLADPLQPRFGAALIEVSDSAIADTGSRRWALQLGGRFGLVRFAPPSRPERPWQLSIEAGFVGQFDIDNSQDNIGWDGIYGLVLARRLSDRFEVKLAVKHFSSHVGDELQERAGRSRINYTREESIFGVSWRPRQRWRLYGEAARGHELRNPEFQKPGRLQAGAECIRPLIWRLDGYAALDLNAFEESDWGIDTTVNVGVALPAGARTWRFGIEYRDGRPTMGEFFEDRERWVGLGVWLDL